MIAVLGAGPHGKQVAAFYGGCLFDDHLPGYEPCRTGAATMPYLLGAAWPRVRRQILSDLPFGCEPWERGLVVLPGAHVGQDVTLGLHTHVLYNAVISHGCKVGSFVTICSGAVLSGEVTVGDDVFIGANATIIHGGLVIGRGATIGAGSVVIHDVPAGATVAGNPARVLVAS